MSDDELPPAGMGGELDGASEDDAFEGDAPSDLPPELPEGVRKEILTEAGGGPGACKMPKAGDEVTVHYVGTLESDGSEFDSSRGRGQPFVFTLGRGQVIKGWDLGVGTMRRGEIAKFTLAPEFAYSDAGSPPKIPPKATLVFEVELISWASRDDLFGDEGVIKTELREGSGWKQPKLGDEVLLSVRAVAADGSVIEERSGFEYVLGSDALGPIGKACDKALAGMKKGEEVELKCLKDYAYGDAHPGGATLTVAVQELFETKDVSFSKDKSVMKKQVKEGDGWDTAQDGAKVKLSVTAASDGSGPIAGFTAGTLEFQAGDGEVCDALECAAVEMKKGETAVLTVSSAAMAAEEKLGLKEVKVDRVVLTLHLEEFERAKEIWDMPEEEKLEWGTARKESGSALLKAGRFEMALQRYKKVGEAFSYADNMKDENKQKARALKIACELNKAAVHLRLKSYGDARTACNTVLKDEKQNVKARYRLAQAELGLKNFMECMDQCKKIIVDDAQNKEARAVFKQAQVGQKEEDKKAQGLFANMCKALGKRPTPNKTAAPEGDGGEDGAAAEKRRRVEGGE